MKCGSKNISKLQYGGKSIIAAYWGSKIIWNSDTSEQDIDIILESIINGTELSNIDLLLLNIKSSNKKYTNINDQLIEIILSGSEYEPLSNPENYLTFEALENGMRISFTNNCQYSLGTNEWFDLEPNTFTPAVKKGKKVYFKAINLTPLYQLGIGTFTTAGYCNVLGNCNSMLFGDNAESNLSLSEKRYAFRSLFSNCITIINASQLKLPTVLSDNCYESMFAGCSSLVSAPALSATSLCQSCYQNMFRGCKSLVTAPELPATKLFKYCYQSMFYGCKTLVSAPALPATLLDEYCYAHMFNNCTSLVTAPLLPATTLYRYCYRSMFEGCTSLVNAPTLFTTKLASGCYSGMFAGCTLLISAPKLPATTLVSFCYQSMFRGCTSLVTAPLLPATTLAEYCYQSMFAECTSLVIAPTLPATSFANLCYESMFNGCSKLNYIKALFTMTPSSTYTSNWVKGVSSTGIFVKNINATWNVTGTHGIPTGWTVQTNFTPVRCINLSITADNVQGKSTNTKIYWTAEVEGKDDFNNIIIATFTGKDISESFPQNTSITDTVQRTISYTYMGVTATTTITQGVWKDQSYTIVLNDNWELSTTVENPDSSIYDGVYQSYSNKGVSSSAAIMYIDIEGYTDFDLYIRSYAESSFDYVMVSQLDQTINNNTSYSNTTLVKAHTSGNQKSGTSIDNYTKVSFTGIDGGQHRITIIYKKDVSVSSGDDRGYVLIPKD